MDLRQVGQGFMSAKFSTNSANPDNCHLQMICRGCTGRLSTDWLCPYSSPCIGEISNKAIGLTGSDDRGTVRLWS